MGKKIALAAIAASFTKEEGWKYHTYDNSPIIIDSDYIIKMIPHEDRFFKITFKDDLLWSSELIHDFYNPQGKLVDMVMTVYAIYNIESLPKMQVEVLNCLNN